MKRAVYLLFNIILVAILLQPLNFISIGDINTESFYQTNEIYFNDNQYGNGYKYYIQGWIYLYISGEPYERGYQHGYLLAEEIADHMTRWSNMIHNLPSLQKINSILTQDEYEKISKIWWNFCKNQCFRLYNDKYNEFDEYKNEILGIANGAKDNGGKIHGEAISYEDVLLINEMYEFLSKLTFDRIRKSFHPLLSLYYNLIKEIPTLSCIKPKDFIEDFYNQPRNHKCNGFIATGDAITHGQIVIGDENMLALEFGKDATRALAGNAQNGTHLLAG